VINLILTLDFDISGANLKVEGREMENISRGPTFGDFVTILTEGSMQDNTIARLQSTRIQSSLSPLY
jgi:hypothetical protein